ncbi:MAG: PAS domain S-box protein [Deltaproteobacteria bacterium]
MTDTIAFEAPGEREDRYRSIVEDQTELICRFRPDYTLTFVNTAYCRFFKKKKEELIGFNFMNLIPDGDRQKVKDQIASLSKERPVSTQVHQVFLPHGDIGFQQWTNRAIFDEKGNIEEYQAVGRDITDRMLAEEAKYRNLIENINDVIFSVDTRKCITYISPAVERFLRYTVNEIMGLPFTRFVHPDDLPALLSRFEKTLSGDLQPYEFRVFAKDGAIFHVRTSSRPLWDDGRLVGLTGVMTDISEFKRAEEALRESEQRLSDIIDFLPDATFAIDRDGKVIAWNRAIEEMTGVKTKDMTGKGDYEYALPFYGIRRPILIDMVFSSDEEIEKKYSFIKKEKDIMLAEADVIMNGENLVLWGKARRLYDSKGNIVGALQSIRDITDRKRAEEAVKKRERELEMKSRNLEELNTALRVLLKRREDDKCEFEERVLANIKQLVLPYIEKMKMGQLEEKDMSYVTILESNLKDIISPFSRRLSSKYLNLTPKEIQIANLIRDGRTTKEIAELLNASPGTIDFHRNNIRHKLDMKKKKANLRTYLLTVS